MIYVDVIVPIEDGDDATKVAVRAGIKLHQIVGFGVEYVTWVTSPDGGSIKVRFQVWERDDV